MFKLAEAKTLVADAIRAGIFNDLGSGSNVDICVITKDKVDYIRPYDVANEKGKRSVQYVFFLSNHSTQDTILHVLDFCQTFTTALLLFFRQGDYSYKKGTTAVLSQKIKRLQYDVLHERMEVS